MPNGRLLLLLLLLHGFGWRLLLTARCYCGDHHHLYATDKKHILVGLCD